MAQEDYISIETYARVEGITVQAARYRCRKGVVPSIKEPAEGRDGFVYKIPASVIKPKCKKAGEKNALKEPQKAEVETDAGIISDRNLDRAEAERLLKVEKAIEIQRENLLQEKKLVDISTIQVDIEETYSVCWASLRELIEKWGIDYKIDARQIKQMIVDFDNALLKSSQKIGRMVNAELVLRNDREIASHTAIQEHQ